MNDYTLLGPWVRRFLLEYLVTERNLAYNTQCSYRDALILLIPFVADKRNKSVDRLTVLDLSANMVRLFQLATSAWLQFMPWPGLSESTAQNISLGVARFVPSLLKNPARQ